MLRGFPSDTTLAVVRVSIKQYSGKKIPAVIEESALHITGLTPEYHGSVFIEPALAFLDCFFHNKDIDNAGIGVYACRKISAVVPTSRTFPRRVV